MECIRLILADHLARAHADRDGGVRYGQGIRVLIATYIVKERVVAGIGDTIFS